MAQPVLCAAVALGQRNEHGYHRLSMIGDCAMLVAPSLHVSVSHGGVLARNATLHR